MKYYILTIEFDDLNKYGPYQTTEARLKAAKQITEGLSEDRGDKIFFADSNGRGELTTGSFSPEDVPMG